MQKLWNILTFVFFSTGLFMMAGCLTVGYSCFKHGDVGPYPECDYLLVMPPASMLLVFIVMELRRKE